MVSNLVDNALRYAGAGGLISVAVRDVPARDAPAPGGAPRQGATSGNNAARTLEIVVSDDGPGIAPDLLPTVFDRFAKTAESRGSGLGLAIARAIVEAHGGTILASSAPARALRSAFRCRSAEGAHHRHGVGGNADGQPDRHVQPREMGRSSPDLYAHLGGQPAINGWASLFMQQGGDSRRHPGGWPGTHGRTGPARPVHSQILATVAPARPG